MNYIIQMIITIVLLEYNNMHHNYNISYMTTYESNELSWLLQNNFSIISDISQYTWKADMITDFYQQVGCTFFDPQKENRDWFLDVVSDIWFWEKYNSKPITRLIFWTNILYRWNALFYAEIMNIILAASLYWDKKIILIGGAIDQHIITKTRQKNKIIWIWILNLQRIIKISLNMWKEWKL